MFVLSCCTWVRDGWGLYPGAKHNRSPNMCTIWKSVKYITVHNNHYLVRLCSTRGFRLLAHDCTFLVFPVGKRSCFLSVEYYVWNSEKAPVCLTVWVIWPLNPSVAVKEDFEPEVSNNIERANEAGKLAFPPPPCLCSSHFIVSCSSSSWVSGRILCADGHMHLRFKIVGDFFFFLGG